VAGRVRVVIEHRGGRVVGLTDDGGVRLEGDPGVPEGVDVPVGGELFSCQRAVGGLAEHVTGGAGLLVAERRRRSGPARWRPGCRGRCRPRCRPRGSGRVAGRRRWPVEQGLPVGLGAPQSRLGVCAVRGRDRRGAGTRSVPCSTARLRRRVLQPGHRCHPRRRWSTRADGPRRHPTVRPDRRASPGRNCPTTVAGAGRQLTAATPSRSSRPAANPPVSMTLRCAAGDVVNSGTRSARAM
jgi:hypothetical protein